jgi:NNP family nitrate/nitrite transporter-like MFS transporter
MTASTQERPVRRWPTLFACFLHFDLSFMLWVLLGALGIFVAEQAHLSPAQKGLVVAVPLLSGSLLRIPLGMLSDRLGPKRVGVGMLTFLFLPLALGWQMGSDLSSLVAIGLMLGTAGASFAVALPLASRWYPPERQGLVMGIAAAGNSGTVITNLFAPRLAMRFGWHNVLGLAMIPLAIVLVVFILVAREPAWRAPLRAKPLALVREPDAWWFCGFYAITFGGYVGLGSFAPLLLRDQYAVSPVTAGLATASIAFAGSGLRPVGGWLADRIGGARLLSIVLVGIAAGYALASRLPSFEAMVGTLLVTMALLGMGNGAVFQLVPQRFQREIGAATGLIGAVGGLGGFFLPSLLGGMKQRAGTFGPGFLVLSGMAIVAVVALRTLLSRQVSWREAWKMAE